jgi:hypothetical protein
MSTSISDIATSRTMQRRTFIAILASALASPLMARAEQPAMSTIGFINGGSAEAYALHLAAFRQRLGDTGCANASPILR